MGAERMGARSGTQEGCSEAEETAGVQGGSRCSPPEEERLSHRPHPCVCPLPPRAQQQWGDHWRKYREMTCRLALAEKGLSIL